MESLQSQVAHQEAEAKNLRRLIEDAASTRRMYEAQLCKARMVQAIASIQPERIGVDIRLIESLLEESETEEQLLRDRLKEIQLDINYLHGEIHAMIHNSRPTSLMRMSCGGMR